MAYFRVMSLNSFRNKMLDRSARVWHCYPVDNRKNEAAQQLGRLGGLARANALTAEQRKAASIHANQAKAKHRALRRLFNEPSTSSPFQRDCDEA